MGYAIPPRHGASWQFGWYVLLHMQHTRMECIAAPFFVASCYADCYVPDSDVNSHPFASGDHAVQHLKLCRAKFEPVGASIRS